MNDASKNYEEWEWKKVNEKLFFIKKHNQNNLKMFAFRYWIDAERCVYGMHRKRAKNSYLISIKRKFSQMVAIRE